MKKLALGLATAAGLLIVAAVPAMAQVDFYAGPGGFDVELGAPYYYGGVYPYRGYYDYYRGPGWVHHHGWHRHYYREW